MIFTLDFNYFWAFLVSWVWKSQPQYENKHTIVDGRLDIRSYEQEEEGELAVHKKIAEPEFPRWWLVELGREVHCAEGKHRRLTIPSEELY